jgi:hypothetical protein
VDRMTPRSALQAAVDGARAYDARDDREVVRLGCSGPGLTFLAAMSLVHEMEQALLAAGGDPQAVRDLVACRAMEPAAA